MPLKLFRPTQNDDTPYPQSTSVCAHKLYHTHISAYSSFLPTGAALAGWFNSG